MSNKKRNNTTHITRAEREAQARALAKKQKMMSVLIPIAVLAVIVAIALALGFTVGGWGRTDTADDGTYTPVATDHAAIEIEGWGTIHLELYGNDAPETVANFKKLAEEGFYNGLTFHRIIDGFMMQGGCPNGDGTGNAGQYIKGEFIANGFNNKILHTAGTLSMARGNSYDSASCQFFITEEDSPHLDGTYAAFGRVTSGMDIVHGICDSANPGYNGAIAPLDQPVIVSITVHPVH